MITVVSTNCDDNLGPVVHEDDVPNIKESVTTQDPNKGLRDPLPDIYLTIECLMSVSTIKRRVKNNKILNFLAFLGHIYPF